MNKKPTFISLFSGCGGFDIGFLKNDFECIGAYDNDSNVVEVYRQNIGNHVFKHDLTKDDLPNKIEEIDVVLSGSPCQGFSNVGLRNFDDPRNSLLLVGGKIAVKYKAKVFVAENVMGSLSGKHKKYWDDLIRYLQSNNFNTKITVCKGVQLGLAQTRKRVILYAWKGNRDIELKYPKLSEKTLRDVISNINGVPNKEFQSFSNNSSDILIAKRIESGKKLSDVRGGERSVHSWDIPEVFGYCTENEKKVLLTIQKLRRKIRRRPNGDSDPVDINVLVEMFPELDIKSIISELVRKEYLLEKEPNHFDIKRSFNGKYRRLDFDSPSFTIDTNFGNPRYFLHPNENRGFSVREAARIQSFEDDFEFIGPINSQFKMIGNAVPPIMAEAIAKNVKVLLNSFYEQNSTESR